MRRRGKLGGKTVKAQRSKTTLTRGKRKVAHHRKVSSADANEKIALLERRLNEALDQQSATSEVLKIISSSPGKLEPVFEVILERATRLCAAKFGHLYLCEGDAFRATALHNAPPAFAEVRRREPLIYPEPGSVTRRLQKGCSRAGCDGRSSLY